MNCPVMPGRSPCCVKWKSDFSKNEIHLAFPMVHGANCEDGTIQGFLQTIGIVYTGNNIYASSVGQDKVFMKQVLSANSIPVTKYVWFGERFYRNKKEELFKQIDELKYPLIINHAIPNLYFHPQQHLLRRSTSPNPARKEGKD